jgi:hypothetical protein
MFTAKELNLVWWLLVNGPHTAKQLVEIAGFSEPAMYGDTGWLRYLCRRGLLKRIPGRQWQPMGTYGYYPTTAGKLTYLQQTGVSGVE